MRTLITGLGVLMSLATTPVFAQSADAPISTAHNAEEGTYLVGGTGFSLYTFKADTRGTATLAAVSACDADCQGSWYPVLVREPPVADDTVDAGMLGAFETENGRLHVTYNGWPLYTYAGDSAPGDITGDDIEEFGEDWYLIGPHGDRPGKNDDDDDDDRGDGGHGRR